MGYSDFLDVRANNFFEYYIVTKRGDQTNISNVVFGRVPATKPTTIAPPTNVTGRRDGNWVSLQWGDPNTAETGYMIERKRITDSAWEIVAFIGINSTGYAEQASSSITWQYRVTTDAEGFGSVPSNVVTFNATT
jgi:hypothetical protein